MQALQSVLSDSQIIEYALNMTKYDIPSNGVQSVAFLMITLEFLAQITANFLYQVIGGGNCGVGEHYFLFKDGEMIFVIHVNSFTKKCGKQPLNGCLPDYVPLVISNGNASYDETSIKQKVPIPFQTTIGCTSIIRLVAQNLIFEKDSPALEGRPKLAVTNEFVSRLTGNGFFLHVPHDGPRSVLYTIYVHNGIKYLIKLDLKSNQTSISPIIELDDIYSSQSEDTSIFEAMSTESIFLFRMFEQYSR